MKVLYLNGGDQDVDATVTAQLSAQLTQLDLKTASTAAEALAGIRQTPDLHALLVSPAVAQNETLALITTLRRDRAPLAIVPVIRESQQDFFASAIAAGADDVLILRDQTLVHVADMLTRIRQSPYLYPAEERRRLQVLYAGRDQLVLNLLEQVPFVKVDRVTCGVDGTCPVRMPGAADGSLRCDAVVVDEHPGDAHPLQVLKSIKAQASDLPVVLLTQAGAGDISAAALDLGADDTVLKSGIFRRRLIATLRRLHQRLELAAQHTALREREARLRQIVEAVPAAIAIVSADGSVLAMNTASLQLFGATKPRDVVGKDIRSLVSSESRDVITDLVHLIANGEAGSIEFEANGVDGSRRLLRLSGALLERDARGRRGMIASIVPADAVVSPEAIAHSERLRASLTDLEARCSELEDRNLADRSMFQAEREALEARLRSTDAESADRAQLQATVERLQAERLELEASLETSRREADADREQLASALAEAERGRQTADAASEALRTELQALQARSDQERGDWASVRSDLEQQHGDVLARLRDANTTADTFRASLVEATSRHETDRAHWDGMARELERLRTETEAAAAAAATGLGSELERLRQDQQNALDTLEAERWAWSTERQTLESDLQHARAALTMVPGLEERLASAREELRLAVDAHTAERSAWQEERERFDTELHAVQVSLTALADLEQRLQAAADDRQMLESEHMSARDSWSAERETWLTEREGWAVERAAWLTERDRLQGELTSVRASLSRIADLELELASAREALSVAADAHASDSAAWRRERDDWHADRQAFLKNIEERRGAHEQDRQQTELLRESLDDERARREIAQQLLEQNTREVDDQIAALRAEHGGIVDALETQLADTLVRLERLTEDRDEEETRFDAERIRLTSDHARLLDSQLFGYALMTLDGRLIRCNDQFARMFGYADAGDAIDRSEAYGFPGLTGRPSVEARLLAERHVPAVDSCLEGVDGRPIRVVESATMLPPQADGERLVERFMVDMTVLGVLEERLRDAKRLEDVGTLTTEMAPEIEHAIATIESAAGTIRQRLSGGNPSPSDADGLIVSASRAAALIRQLSSFSRRQLRTPEPIRLNDVVEREEPTFRRLVGGHIDFQIHLGRAATLAIDEDDLDQLLTSLVVSGRDLLPVGGSLILETRRTDANRDENEGRRGLTTVLAIRASGYGVLTAEQLPPVELLARRCGGELHVENSPGHETEIRVSFSRCARTPADARHAIEHPRSTSTY
jgi:PAS domain S-box-containing protein